MDSFRDYFEMSALMDIIGKVPQRPDYHAEGPVGVHTRMVRAQLDNAIATLQKAAANPNSPLSNLDTRFSEEDRNILRLAAWLHDLGKASATTIGGKPWWEVPNPDLSAARSAKHEMPYHFNPMAKQLLKSSLWQKIASSANFEDKKDLWFLIRNHMDVSKDGFDKKLSKRFVDENGKYRNERRIKLLLALILMDRTGRIGSGQKFEKAGDFFDALERGATKQLRKYQRMKEKQSEPGSSNPMEFVKSVGDNLRRSMAKYGEFGPEQRSFLEKQLTMSLRAKNQKEGLGLTDDAIKMYVDRYLNG